jgi:hypothetical protein
MTQEITSFIAVILFVAFMDVYIFWYHQDTLRILITIGLNFIVLMGYNIARDTANLTGDEDIPRDGSLEKSSEFA